MMTTVLKPDGETLVLTDYPRIALTTVDDSKWNNDICGPIQGSIDD